MRYLPALILDALLVLIFAAIGRASHSEDPAGFLLTAWPFLVALLIGHALAAILPGRPRRPWSVPWGAIVWVVTVSGGMLLRIVSGDTAQLPFIIVATLTLGVFLVGWRVATALLRRRRANITAVASGTAATAAHEDDRVAGDRIDGVMEAAPTAGIMDGAPTADPGPDADLDPFADAGPATLDVAPVDHVPQTAPFDADEPRIDIDHPNTDPPSAGRPEH